MSTKVERRTVDLAAYPDLVVIYLGMRVNAFAGLKTLFGFGPKIANAVRAAPDGLLLHENIVFSLFPPHVGMRQYAWWKQFVQDSGGTGFWHESYFMRGGMEAVYDGMVKDTGFLRFAPIVEAKGSMFSARGRARRDA
jgi:hypothetical protein